MEKTDCHIAEPTKSIYYVFKDIFFLFALFYQLIQTA